MSSPATNTSTPFEFSWDSLLSYAQHYGADYVLHGIYAVVIFIIGIWAARICRHLIVKLLKRRKVEETIRIFLSQVLYFTILSFVLVAVLAQIGIQTASLVAVIGAMGLAISFSLRNSLSNIASGILLVVNKPFKVGDFVDLGGSSGTIEKINLFLTTLKTSDNQTICLSNGQVMNSKIVNYSDRDTRRINITVGIGYDDDIDKAKSVLLKLIEKDERFLKDPAPLVAVSELADSSVNLVFRVWVKRTDYWPIFYDCNEMIKKALDKHKINIPYPQRDVHLYQSK